MIHAATLGKPYRRGCDGIFSKGQGRVYQGVPYTGAELKNILKFRRLYKRLRGVDLLDDLSKTDLIKSRS